MNIFVDLTQLFNYPCGIATYVVSLYRKMLALEPALTLTTGHLSLNTKQHQRYSSLTRKFISPDITLKYRLFPGRFPIYEHPLLLKLLSLPTRKYDICHIPGNFAPSCFPISYWDNAVLTIHDLFVFHPEIPHNANESDSLWLNEFKRHVKDQATRARHIVTVSEYTRKDIIQLFNIPSEKITVIPNAPQWLSANIRTTTSAPENPTVRQLMAEKFYIAVSNIAPHKNYLNLCTAWEKFHSTSQYGQEKLVIVGKDDTTALSTKINQTRDVIRLRNISSEDLRLLYTHALGAFSISFFEGFGIPLLEAMSCGCPACYSRETCLEEIGRDACYSVAPDSIDEIVDVFLRFRNEDQSARKEKAFAIAGEYTWDNIARQYLELFKKIT